MMKQFNKNTVFADIEKIRGAITALQEEAAWIQTSKPPKSDLIDRLNKWVNQLAVESDSIRHLMYDDDSRDLFKAATQIDYEGHGRSVKLAPILCELFADQIKNNLAKKIEALDYEPGPAWAERPRLLEQNAMQIKELELAEERLISEAEKVGVFVPRRAELDPAVFLEIDQFPPLPEVPVSLGAIEYRKRQAELTQMAEAIDRANSTRLVVSRDDTDFEIR